ncbi:MAG TPA: peptidylprolyl isomerase [Phnomibacter sp.]|nr:peptidylprolyl isomerase [Phnomibacter sp.]
MSIIQSIRDKAAPVTIGVIAISLIGFILMDAGRSNRGGGVSPTDAVGEINGVDLSWEAFQKQVKLNEQMYEMQGRSVDENTRQQIYSDTWRTMVDEELLTQEYSKLGIDVSDKEFNDLLFGANPPQWLTQQFTNPETGAFDVVAAKQAINELKKNKANTNRDLINDVYLDPMISGTKRSKFFSLLQNSAYAPKWMAEKTIADNGLAANFSYVVAPYSAVSDSTVKVSDAQINDYIKAHESEFKTDENSRSIAYVSFSFLPSGSDTADANKALNDLKAEFAAAPDAGTFVTRNGSSLPFFDGYISKGRIQIAAKDSIIGAGVGKVYGPYLDGNSFVMSRIVDVKVLPDSVRAKHILIGTFDPRTQQQTLSDEVAKKRIDSIEALVKGGASFDALAMSMSDDEGSKMLGGDVNYFASGKMVKEFNDFCFDKKTGDMGVVKTSFGYHLIKITDQKDFSPSYKIAYMAKPIEASQATINDAQLKANTFATHSQDLKSFDATVTKDNLSKLIAQEIKESDFQVGTLGVNRSLVKDIFKADVGSVISDPIELNDQFIVVAVTNEDKKGLPSAGKVRPMVESIVRNELKGKLLAEKVKGVTTLDAAAQKLNVPVLRADSVSFLSPLIGGAGYELKAGGFGFNKANLNKVSGPIAGTAGLFLVQPLSIFANPAASANVEETMKNIVNQQRNTLLYSSMDALKKAASVTDKRSKFL